MDGRLSLRMMREQGERPHHILLIHTPRPRYLFQ